MVHLKYRVAALRTRPTGGGAPRTDRDGPWDPVPVLSAGRTVRPWVGKIELVDGSHLYLRPCLPGEAVVTECGRSIGASRTPRSSVTTWFPALSQSSE